MNSKPTSSMDTKTKVRSQTPKWLTPEKVVAAKAKFKAIDEALLKSQAQGVVMAICERDEYLRKTSPEEQARRRALVLKTVMSGKPANAEE